MPTTPLARFVAWLTALQKTGGGLIVTVAVAAAAAIAALALSTTTPFRFIENFTSDLRIATMAPPAQPDFVIVKMDDAAYAAMREASPCHCLAPINKAWLADVIAALDAKGVRAIGVDYLLDTWDPANDNQEFKDFVARTANVKAPVVAVVDPAYKPGVDFPIAPHLRYSDARALTRTDYDDVIRRYDPMPGKMPALSTEVAYAIGVKPFTKPFTIRYRRADPTQKEENAGAIGPSYSAAYVAFVPEQQLKGKIAFIGSVTRSATADSSTVKEDMHTTPLRFTKGHHDGTPGVEVHVHALSQMMAGDMIRQPGLAWSGLLVFAAALGGAAFGRGTSRWWIAVAVIVVTLAAAIGGALAAFKFGAVMLPVTAPSVSFALAFFVVSRLAAAELQISGPSIPQRWSATSRPR